MRVSTPWEKIPFGFPIRDLDPNFENNPIRPNQFNTFSESEIIMSHNATSESTANKINKKSNELNSRKEQNDATGETSESDSDDEYYDDEWKENLESKGSMQKEKMMGIIKTFERKVREFCKTNSYYDWWNQEYPFYCKNFLKNYT